MIALVCMLLVLLCNFFAGYIFGRRQIKFSYYCYSISAFSAILLVGIIFLAMVISEMIDNFYYYGFSWDEVIDAFEYVYYDTEEESIFYVVLFMFGLIISLLLFLAGTFVAKWKAKRALKAAEGE